MEIKTRKGNINEEVYKILKKHNKLNQVVWGSKNYEESIKLTNNYPSVARFCCKTEFLRLIIGYFFGYLPFLSLAYDTVQLPYYTEGLKKTAQLEIRSPLKRILFTTFVRLCSYISDPLFVHLHRRGIESIFWVINKENELKGCLEYEGISGIMTD